MKIKIMADNLVKSQEMRAERIKKLREEFGISKADMARMCGITQTAYTNIENAETKSITIETGKKIANSLKISFFELFDIDGDSQKIDSLKNEIETLRKRIVELEEQLDDKRKANLSAEGTIKYWNLFAKYTREILSENKNISAVDLESKVLEKIYNIDGPFVVTIDDKKNWSFSFRGEK